MCTGGRARRFLLTRRHADRWLLLLTRIDAAARRVPPERHRSTQRKCVGRGAPRISHTHAYARARTSTPRSFETAGQRTRRALATSYVPAAKARLVSRSRDWCHDREIGVTIGFASVLQARVLRRPPGIWTPGRRPGLPMEPGVGGRRGRERWPDAARQKEYRRGRGGTSEVSRSVPRDALLVAPIRRQGSTREAVRGVRVERRRGSRCGSDGPPLEGTLVLPLPRAIGG